MTIRPGQPWGEVVERPAPETAAAAGDDAAAARLLADRAAATVLVAAGDLVRTVGGASSGSTVRRYPVDLLDVVADGRIRVALAHVVVRRRGLFGWWRGPLRAVMNVGLLGDWDVAPRAHPNDGRLDVVEVDAGMSVGDRWRARPRLPTGTHIPHPAISITTRRNVAWRFESPMHLWIDGVASGRVRELAVDIRPDAAVVYV
jgi:hypothetical protein